MAQYLMSVYQSASDEMPSEDEINAMFAAVDVFNEQLKRDGAWVFAGGLTDVGDAKVVDGRTTSGADGASITDGPYSESREWLGGFWVIEAPHLEAALELARQGSAACGGKVEVRAFQPE